MDLLLLSVLGQIFKHCSSYMLRVEVIAAPRNRRTRARTRTANIAIAY